MSEQENKQCPRCHRFFECNVASIALCQCSEIKLNHKQREYIKSRYDDCLCQDCLKELDHELNGEK